MRKDSCHSIVNCAVHSCSCAYMYSCMYTCMYSTCTCIHACTGSTCYTDLVTSTRKHIHCQVYTLLYMYIYIHTCTQGHNYIHDMYMYICPCVHDIVCTNTHVHVVHCRCTFVSTHNVMQTHTVCTCMHVYMYM